MAASSHTTSSPAPPSRSSPRFQPASEKQSSDDDEQEAEKQRRPSRTKAPIATRTRHALNYTAPSSNQTDDSRKTHSRKPSDAVTDGEAGTMKKTDEDEDMAKILASLPAKKRAKLAATRAQIKKEGLKDTKENGAGSPNSSSDDKTSNDNCETCGGVGEFICCEGCPKVFHFVCVEPPMDGKDVANIKGKWFCTECRAKRHPPRINHRSVFGTLLYKLEATNPVLFELPKDIKNLFQGVSSNEFGEYVDSGSFKHVRRGKNGMIEEPDYFRLRDKNGQFILCYRCRKSALREKPIIACDHCSLYWHLDCLDPPLASAPNLSRKWMCPNHVEMAMQVRKRQRRHPVIIEPDNPLETKNNGDIQIIDDESDAKWAADQMFKYAGVVYRLPESAVKLHFVDHIKALRQSSEVWSTKSSSRSSQHSPRQDTNSPMSSPVSPSTQASLLASTSADQGVHNLKVAGTTRPSAQESREWLEGLAALQSDIVNYLKDDLKDDNELDHRGLKMLIRAALGSKQDTTNSDLKVESSSAKAEKYKAIEELIRIKGEDALLEFLTQENNSS
ncbi:hypothetical protein INT44_000873 [Umbelopsis vinacea]|uniref:PHD-type domain-containing protein n=1 Tax=Umbelopsis vinacea TaxID=44442 RepID=A0A8H7UND9_9FUNG|nr:hypothetical protein INT44_000873 [Umbelopsis vinacea]